MCPLLFLRPEVFRLNREALSAAAGAGDVGVVKDEFGSKLRLLKFGCPVLRFKGPVRVGIQYTHGSA